MNKEILANRVYERLLEDNVSWVLSGSPQRPSFEDVEMLLDSLADEIKLDRDISIEVGGVLMKCTDDSIDVYVKVGSYVE